MDEEGSLDETDTIDIPQQSLFTINSNYNTAEINKVIKSSTNLFSHISPLFTQTMTSFRNDKNKFFTSNTNSKSKKNLEMRNNNALDIFSKPKTLTYFNPIKTKSLKTQTNFNKKPFLLSPNNPPTIKDRIKLTSYYKISGSNKHYKSPEEKEFKNNLFEKYKIKIHKPNDYDNNFPTINDNNLHLKINKQYFKNSYKANKTIDINRQLVHRVNEMTNFFLIKKYFQKIENNQRNRYFIKKMPKVQIKSKAKKNGFKKDNEMEEENSQKDIKKNKKLRNSELFQNKKLNLLGAIKFSRFRKFAYNGLIEFQCEEEDDELNLMNSTKSKSQNKKAENSSTKNMTNFPTLHKNKIEKHFLSLKISKLSQAFKPCSRMDFSISKIGNKIYIYGGVCSKIYNELWMYNIDKNKWTQIHISEKDDPSPRKGHTSIIIKDTLFIYGGEIPKERPYEDLITYNLLTNKIHYPKIAPKKKINQRIGHILVGTNQTFLIQGGMDSRTHTIENSAFFYNIFGNYWQRLECIGQKLPYRMHHCAVMVNYYAKCSSAPYSFYFPPDDYQEGSVRKIRHEGVYIFGGMNEKKNYTNDVYIIKIGHKPCVNIKPKIAGPPPEPRIKAKMDFIDNFYFLIIHGGIKTNQNFCGDIVVLNLENYNWIKPIIGDSDGESLTARIEHQIFVHGEKLYIFGGLGDESILSMSFEVVEFEVTGFFDNYMLPDQSD